MLELLDRILEELPVLILGIFGMVLILCTHPDAEDLIVRLMRRHK